MTQEELQKTAEFFYELGTMRMLPRMHRQVLLQANDADNIASHSWRVAAIAWCLAELEGADPYKAAGMALFHDMEELRSGDHNWVHKRYVKVFEDEVVQDQGRGLPFEKTLQDARNEYKERATPEARLVKDADLLEQLLLLREYAHAGNKEAEKWITGGREHYLSVLERTLTSESAKQLAMSINETDPGAWWSKIWTERNR